MIKVLYFAAIREDLNCSEEELEPGTTIKNIADLKRLLAERENQWQAVFSDNKQPLSSINQVIAKDDQIINDGDEVAFFLPVTGG